ncbi:TIM-barrel domain-containing protein [Dactylosporangium sp. NPDC051541]|uniref:glycoside hydrolase family 31 protein n=1 Tax=Dactylosporangium sp. NPDC051541 TaxID=3363977 RepID=UPI0037AA6893
MAGAADPAAVVSGEHYRITVLTDGLVRLEYAEDGRFEDRRSTFANERNLPVPDFRVLESGGHLEIVTARFRLTYDRGPFTSSGLSLAVGGGLTAFHSVWRYGQTAESLGGTARTLDGADGPVPLEPGVIARSGFAVLDDGGSFLFDEDGWVAADNVGRTDLYVFAYGHDYTEALRAFYAVSGPVPPLPRWALGNWWSRHHAYTEESYLALLDRFRDEGIPFSVGVLDMDWHLVDVDPAHGSGWTGYTWNRHLFPDPAAFLARLHAIGLRVSLNVHPADGVRSFEAAYPAMAAALGRDPAPGEPIAFDVTDRRFLEAYFQVLHRGLEADGVDFWWLDWQSGPYSRTAGIDPLWMLNHFHYLDNGRLTFSRYAGPGSHRYPVGFSGDTVVSWASLAFQPHFTATAANIGYGWWSHDIGGHFFGLRDDELATRWLQLGTFSPILRLHSAKNPFLVKEPWAFPDPARAVMTEFLRLRHRLVPYLHTMNHGAAAGRPLVLPMYYREPGREEAYAVPHQYQFGTELLVAAVTEPADRRTLLARVKAWLPGGVWVDVFTGLVYSGGRMLYLHRDLTTIPVLAPAGAIIPLDGAAIPANDPVRPAHVELLVVVGADGEFELVEDESSVRIAFAQDSGTLTVGPSDWVRTWTVTLLAHAPAAEVVANVDGGVVFANIRQGDTRTSITIEAVPAAATLRIELGPGPRLRRNDVAGRVFALLNRAQIEYRTKTRVLEAATADAPLAVRLATLPTLDLEEPLLTAVTEILTAQA